MKNIFIILFTVIIINTTGSGYGASLKNNNDIDTTNSFKNAVIAINSIEEFKFKIQNTNQIVLVEFYSDWCTPCRKMAPILNKFTLNNADKLSVYKVNFDYMQEIVHNYNIFGIPTILIFMNGKEVKRVPGFRNYNQLELLIDTLLNE